MLIIFTGLPGTGKTTMSQKIAATLNLPLIGKDVIKEILFDEIGGDDSVLLGKLAQAAIRIMDYTIEQQLGTGQSFMVESNFMPQYANKKFHNWQIAYGYKTIQVVCKTDLDVLAERYHRRSLTNRHPGHQDIGTVGSHRTTLMRRIENDEDRALDIRGSIYNIDTTNFQSLDIEGLVHKLRKELSFTT